MHYGNCSYLLSNFGRYTSKVSSEWHANVIASQFSQTLRSQSGYTCISSYFRGGADWFTEAVILFDLK